MVTAAVHAKASLHARERLLQPLFDDRLTNFELVPPNVNASCLSLLVLSPCGAVVVIAATGKVIVTAVYGRCRSPQHHMIRHTFSLRRLHQITLPVSSTISTHHSAPTQWTRCRGLPRRREGAQFFWLGQRTAPSGVAATPAANFPL